MAHEVNEIFQRVRTRESIVTELTQKAEMFNVGESRTIFMMMLKTLEGDV